MNLYIEKLWQVPKHLNYPFINLVTHFSLFTITVMVSMCLQWFIFSPVFLLGSNAAVNMEISESVGKMRIVPFHYDSTIMYYCSAFAESLQTK